MAQQFVSNSTDSIPAVNGGVALSMGASTGLLGARAPQTPNLGVSGSTVVAGSNVAKSKAAGTLAHSHKLPLTFFVTNELAGVASSALASPQNPEAWIVRSATSTAYVRQTSTAFRNGDFNIFTGKFTVAPTVVQQCMYSINTAAVSCDADVADHATSHPRATKAARTFVFHIGAKSPVKTVFPLLGDDEDISWGAFGGLGADSI